MQSADPVDVEKARVLYLLDGLIPHMYEGKLTGKVLLDEQDITEELPRNRCDKIGFVMQNPESQFCNIYSGRGTGIWYGES